MKKRMSDKSGRKLGSQGQSPYCIHVEQGRAGTPKICIRNYECWHCAFDQWIEEAESSKEKARCFNKTQGFLAKAA